MKVLTLMLLLLGALATAQIVAAQTPTQPVPAWVSTVAPQAGMLPPASIITITVYDAQNAMRPYQQTLVIGGYWKDLYYCYDPINPALVFLIGRGGVPNG